MSPDECRELSSDRALYHVAEPFRFESSILGVLTVPEGFITDFASIPRAALWYIDDDDPAILFPSIVHDYLYTLKGTLPTSQTYGREQADQVLREGMELCGGRKDQIAAVYWSVRIGGGGHWK